MIKLFGNPYDDFSTPVRPIRTVEQMQDAMKTLFWFRVDQGLEFPVMFDILWIDPMEYSMCSRETMKLAEIYT